MFLFIYLFFERIISYSYHLSSIELPKSVDIYIQVLFQCSLGYLIFVNTYKKYMVTYKD